MYLNHLLAVTLLCCFINAITGPLALSVSLYGLTGLGGEDSTGIVIIAIASWCLFTLFTVRPARQATTAEITFCCLITVLQLIPSATLAWLSGATVSLWGYCRSSGTSSLTTRSALIIFTVMSLRTPLISALLTLLAEPLLYLDAWLVKSALIPLSIDIAQQGNLIIAEQGHSLAIMTGCSSFTNLSLALLVWFTISRARLHSIPITAWYGGVMVCLAITGLNITRLSLMALNPELYHFFHDSYGQQLFEAALTLATLLITLSIQGVYDGSDHSDGKPVGRSTDRQLPESTKSADIDPA